MMRKIMIIINGHDLINSQPIQPNLSGRYYCERDRDGLALGGSGAQSYTLSWGGVGGRTPHPTVKLTRSNQQCSTCSLSQSKTYTVIRAWRHMVHKLLLFLIVTQQ